MAFQLSPGVNVSEVDLTTVVPAVSTTAGAFVGDFQWGPAEKRTLVTHETDLVAQFGKPSANSQQANSAVSFFCAANFLAYGTNLQVVRSIGANALNATTGTTAILIKNEDSYDVGITPVAANGIFAARYAGELGNSLKVSVCTANTVGFSSWTYKSTFSVAPTTSSYVSSVGGANDQIHLVVVDEDGAFTGATGTVLEVFPFLSQAADAIYDDGSSAYYANVLREQSKYIYALTTVSAFGANTGNTAANTTFGANTTSVIDTSLSRGVQSESSVANIDTGLDLFANKDEVDISLIVTGFAADANTTIQNAAIELATSRKDCMAFVSPPKGSVVGNASPAAAISTWSDTLNKSSFAFADSGWKYQFDKYNNIYRWIPLNGDIAGLCVRTDETRDPWFSPAGYSRGAIKNVVKLAWNPNQTQRDTIYAKAINPVISAPGQGTLLFGDKTLITQPSAFDRINVRRLFIVLEKAIATSAKYSLFELNDEFTRAQFIALVEPFLRDVKGRRGIYDYRVVCDTTNNTAQVIDSNKFIGDIYIKPARSINFIQLNFVAVRSGVNFTEIVGAV
jgi:phage tail sheath protein FI